MKTTLLFLVQIFFFPLVLHLCSKYVTGLPDNSHYLMHNCPNTSNTYISGGKFEAALNDILFSKMPEKALQAIFSDFSNGTGIDQLNVLFYCSGDVAPSACQDCVKAAASKATEQCKLMKEAIVWFEECTLRYANHVISSIDEEDPVYIYTNKTGIMNDYVLDPFKDEFDSTMSSLVEKVAKFRIMQGFATAQFNISSSQVLRCVVQCTPDIIGAPCEKCLRSALNQRDRWADTMVFLPSCSVRVDLYKSTTPPTSTRKGPKSLPTVIIIFIALGSVFAVVAIVISIFCCSRFYYALRACMVAITQFVVAIPSWVVDVSCYYPDLKGLRALKKFTYRKLVKATNDFECLLGGGGFGQVYKGTIRTSELAVKKLKPGLYERKHEFLSELNHNSCASHKNVVSVIGYCSQGKHRLLVYEFLPNNCLHKHLHGDRAGDRAGAGLLTWEKRMKIAVGTATGLKYLHHECIPKIIHRDIKSANILLDSEYEPKLADFGLSKVFPDDKSHITSDVKGTIGYLDPAYHMTSMLTEKTDVYSFGIVLLELITGRWPTELIPARSTSLSLLKGLESTDALDRLVDKNLHSYDRDGISSMIICAALCAHPSSECRLSMRQTVKLLEERSLLPIDVAHIISYAGMSFPENSSKRLELGELKTFAIEVLERDLASSSRLIQQDQASISNHSDNMQQEQASAYGTASSHSGITLQEQGSANATSLNHSEITQVEQGSAYETSLNHSENTQQQQGSANAIASSYPENIQQEQDSE